MVRDLKRSSCYMKDLWFIIVQISLTCKEGDRKLGVQFNVMLAPSYFVAGLSCFLSTLDYIFLWAHY